MAHRVRKPPRPPLEYARVTVLRRTPQPKAFSPWDDSLNLHKVVLKISGNRSLRI